MWQVLGNAWAWVVGSVWRAAGTAAAVLLVLFLFYHWLGTPAVAIYQTAATPGAGFERTIQGILSDNFHDFIRWYRANIIIQVLLVSSSLIATILASVTNQQNVMQIKMFSIVLTALTTALISVQSTFHVRDNIETFIKANTDLQLLQSDYELRKARFQAGPANAELERLVAEKTKDFMKIEEARMRAYAVIGTQPSQNLPANVPLGPLPGGSSQANGADGVRQEIATTVTPNTAVAPNTAQHTPPLVADKPIQPRN